MWTGPAGNEFAGQSSDLNLVGAPLPRRTAVQQHRRHQIRTSHLPELGCELAGLPVKVSIHLTVG
jgi:hypothetical protein